MAPAAKQSQLKVDFIKLRRQCEQEDNSVKKLGP